MKVFLFPIGQVMLYPGTSKPLRIFEERYLKMVEDSLAQNIPIAIGYVGSADSESFRYQRGQKISFVREVAGYGRPQVLEQRPDGTVLILLPGQGKARLGPVIDDSGPYLILEAEPIPENLQLSDSAQSSFLTLQKLLLSWLQNNIEDPRAREEFRKHLKSPEQIVGCVASYLVADPDLQQMVLEADSLDEKVSLFQA